MAGREEANGEWRFVENMYGLLWSPTSSANIPGNCTHVTRPQFRRSLSFKMGHLGRSCTTSSFTSGKGVSVTSLTNSYDRRMFLQLNFGKSIHIRSRCWDGLAGLNARVFPTSRADTNNPFNHVPPTDDPRRSNEEPPTCRPETWLVQWTQMLCSPPTFVLLSDPPDGCDLCVGTASEEKNRRSLGLFSRRG